MFFHIWRFSRLVKGTSKEALNPKDISFLFKFMVTHFKKEIPPNLPETPIKGKIDDSLGKNIYFEQKKAKTSVLIFLGSNLGPCLTRWFGYVDIILHFVRIQIKIRKRIFFND